MPSLKDRIISILVDDKIISQEDIDRALSKQKEAGGRLSDILMGMGVVKEDKLMAALSKVFSKPSIDLNRMKIDTEVLKLIPQNICRQYSIIPISKFADTLTLAMSDPLNIFALDDVKSLTGFNINPILADSKRISQAIEDYYGNISEGIITGLIDAVAHEKIELVQIKKEDKTLSAVELGRLTGEAPIVSFTNKMLESAVAMCASDILIESFSQNMRVRFKIDGTIREYINAPIDMQALVVSRIKVISCLDIAEHRLPQDGRFKIKLAEREVDFRVSVIPSNKGERVAIRILDRANVKLDVNKLGFQENCLNIIKKCALLPHGMMLVCGPTGSGKTTTLYSFIKLVDTPKANIVTVEDPVEFQLHGVNQVNVNPDTGLTFGASLRAILRQDPNVIMIGEIRDLETIDIAIKSALTGHLVLSTLHTTTASGALVRILNMGVEPFLISASINVIVAQRLLRVLCPGCKEKYELTPDMVALLKMKVVPADNIFYRAKGCSACAQTGYKGRVIIAEAMLLNSKIKDLVLARADEQKIKEAAQAQDMQTLREDGMEKAKSGITSLEEVLRVTAADE